MIAQKLFHAFVEAGISPSGQILRSFCNLRVLLCIYLTAMLRVLGQVRVAIINVLATSSLTVARLQNELQKSPGGSNSIGIFLIRMLMRLPS